MDAISPARVRRLLRAASIILLAGLSANVPGALGAVGVTQGIPNVSASGSANYEIPIWLPPGTNGLTPRVSLQYDHRQGNGLLGVGWSIPGFSAISRCNKTIAQDGAISPASLHILDAYCLDGNRLRHVAGSGSYGAAGTVYRTEIETFARITAQGFTGAGPQSWEVRTKDGLIYEYGVTADSRIETLTTATPRVWALNRIRDRAGNYIDFVYSEDTTNGSYRPTQILYTGHTTLGTAPATKVEFVYETLNRPDPVYRYRFGTTTIEGKIHEFKRLDRIDVIHQAAAPVTVRTYQLEYESPGGAGGRTRLETIQECRASDCYPATDLTWINGTSGWPGGATSTGTSIGTPMLIGDISGDGRDDVVWSSSTTSGGGLWTYMLGTDTGFGAATPTAISNWNYTGAQAIEWNGDNLMDILVPCSGGGTTWCVLQANGVASGFTLVTTTTPSTGWTTNKVLALDADGDGRDDLLRISSNTQMGIRLRGPSGFGGETTAWQTPGFDRITGDFSWLLSIKFRSVRRNWDFDGDGREDFFLNMRYDEGPGGGAFNYVGTFHGNGATLAIGGNLGTTILPTMVGDGNGDGLSDVYFFTASSNYYRMSRGRYFTPNIAGPPNTGLIENSALLLDHDGDGLDDLVVAKDSSSTWFVARSTGNALSTLTSLGFTTALVSGKAADVNGDGLADLISGGGFRLHEGVYPDLLDRATDGFLNYVDFNYARLTAGGPTYTKGSTAAFPSMDYQGPLYVVSSYTATDGIGATFSMTYSYAEARHHLEGRGFLGFKMFKATDGRNGVRTEQTFLQDPTQYQAIGALDLVQIKQGGGALIAETDNTWNHHAYAPGSQERRFPFIATQAVKRYEAAVGTSFDGDHLTTATTTNLVDVTSGTVYDSTTTTEEHVTANGVQNGAVYEARTYHPTAQLLNDTSANWCIGRPQETQFINSHNQYGGAPSTRTVSRTIGTSQCRVEQEIIEPASTQWKVTRDIGYDGWGNVNSVAVTGIGMATRTHTGAWGTTGRFLASLTNPLSQVVQFGWDAEIGAKTSQTDPNGLVTAWQHDAFARLAREDRPDGTETTWSYVDCAVDGCLSSSNKLIVKTTQLDTADDYINDLWTYVDMLLRPIAMSTRMLGGSYNRTEQEYDALGRIHRRSAPCWSAGCTQYWTTYSYDVLNRPVQVSRPKSDSDATPVNGANHFEGLTTRTVDALGKENTRVVNALGGLLRSIDDDDYFQTFDVDAFGNVVRVTDSQSNTLQTITYNIRGMKTAHSDMDLGGWTFTPNALGEVTSQTDAKTQGTTFVYDSLGRLTSRTEAEGTSTWTWGTSAAAKNIGSLASVSGPGYSESYLYDASARPQTTTINSDAAYQIDYAYNAIGGLHTLTYPTSTSSYRLKVQYDYQHGQLLRVKDFNAPTMVFWQANSTDPRGNIVDENLGPALRTARGFDLVTGMVDSIVTGPGADGSIQDLTYVWNAVGNLTERTDDRQNLTETFEYDDLHRLVSSDLNSAPNLTVAYDYLGNITSKSDVGSYTYHATKKHAVTAAGSNTFAYDANGNVTTRNGSSTSWYSYNLPNAINASGSNSSQFFYAPNRGRWKQVASYAGTAETTIYIGGLIEKVTRAGVTSWKHYIAGGSGPVAAYTRKDDATNAIHYLTRDHLGSVDSVTNAAGAIEVRLSYDAFGKRRNEAGWSGALPSGDLTQITATTRRGFTPHEMLDNVGLIHMNGRVYDPLVGRFLSADPLIQSPAFTQSFNRYSYVFNSPLSFTDPSGFDSLRRVWLCIDGPCQTTTNPIGDAWPRVQQPNRESQMSGNGVGNNPPPTTPTTPPAQPQPTPPSPADTSGCIAGPPSGSGGQPVSGGCASSRPTLAEWGKRIDAEDAETAQLIRDEEEMFARHEAARQAFAEEREATYARDRERAWAAIGWIPSLRTGKWVLGGFGIQFGKAAAKATTQALPKLQRIHSVETLTKGSARYDYDAIRKMSTDDIVKSLRPGSSNPLKVSADGRIFEGNTRILVLEERGFDINSLPRVPYP